MKKIYNYLILIVFILSILIPLSFSDFKGGQISETEKRTLAQFPKIFTNDLKLATGIRSGLENWINDNIGFRSKINRIKAIGEFHLFHISPTPLVHVGKNGWLFYTGDNNIEIGTGNYKLSHNQLESIKNNQVDIQQALKKRGIEYVIVFPPSKASIYPEYIRGNYSVGETLVDVVTNYLQENTTIPVINLKPDLLNAKNSKLVYFKTDTHWNYEGSYIGYCSIIDKLNFEGILHSMPVKTSYYPSKFTGDLSLMLNVGLPPEPFTATKVINANAILIKEGHRYDQLSKLLELNNVKNELISYQNSTTEEPTALIYRDSFFTFMNKYLAENFSAVDFVWSYNITADIVDFVKPDIVIFEITERLIPQMVYLSSSSIDSPTINP